MGTQGPHGPEARPMGRWPESGFLEHHGSRRRATFSRKTYKTIRKQKSIYYGLNRQYQKEEIENEFWMYDVKKSNIKEVAKLIKEYKLVGVFGNKSESGPRALGNRSLLYNPTDPGGQNKVNEVKKRESFRPFACSILEDKLNEYFITDIKKSPYMMYAIKSISDKIPAVLHVDHTCRLQTVSENDNKYFYEVIKSFEELQNDKGPG